MASACGSPISSVVTIYALLLMERRCAHWRHLPGK
jgi:hypothetical protein